MKSDNDLLHQSHPIKQHPPLSNEEKSDPIWQDCFILLLIVDAILAYFLSTLGDRIELIKVSFLLLPIVNLMFVCGVFITGIGLLRIGFILLLTVNLMFAYNVYDQERYGIGPEFLGIIPFLSVLAINDLIAVLFYNRTRRPQGIIKVICNAVLIPTSIVLILSFLIIIVNFPLFIGFIESIFALFF